jgi:hypothetical protein
MVAMLGSKELDAGRRDRSPAEIGNRT